MPCLLIHPSFLSLTAAYEEKYIMPMGGHFESPAVRAAARKSSKAPPAARATLGRRSPVETALARGHYGVQTLLWDRMRALKRGELGAWGGAGIPRRADE